MGLFPFTHHSEGDFDGKAMRLVRGARALHQVVQSTMFITVWRSGHALVPPFGMGRGLWGGGLVLRRFETYASLMAVRCVLCSKERRKKATKGPADSNLPLRRLGLGT